MDADRQNQACLYDCRACPSSAAKLPSEIESGEPEPLCGRWFTMASAWVFLGPPLLWIVAQLIWAESWGELPAAAAGLGLSALFVLPAVWLLRRR